MKELEDKTLDEIMSSNNQEELAYYCKCIEEFKTNPFSKAITEQLYGESLSTIYYQILEEEQQYTSSSLFPGDFIMFYPNIRERKARKITTCDFSAGIIYPGSIYINYRPLIKNLTTGENYVLQRTIKVEMGYQHELPTDIQSFEALEQRLQIDGYEDHSGIEYSHFSQRMGGELLLKKLKRRKSK